MGKWLNARVILNPIAFCLHGENKDTYDLYCLVPHYGAGMADVASRLKTLFGDPSAKRALEYLREDLGNHQGIGPGWDDQFLTGGPDDAVPADAVVFVGKPLDHDTK